MVTGIVTLVVAMFAATVYRAMLLPRGGPKVTTVSLPLEFSMQLERTEFQQDKVINVSLTLRNISNSTLVLEWHNGCIFDLVVDDSNRTRVWDWQSFHAYPEAVFGKTLSSGESLSYYYWWFQTVPWEGAVGPYPAGQVPKGTCFIKGALFPFMLTAEGHIAPESVETPAITTTIK
jgi:hypothetical protein